MKGTFSVHTFRSWLFRPRTLAGSRPIAGPGPVGIGRLYLISRIKDAAEIRSRTPVPVVLSRVRGSIEINSILPQLHVVSRIEEFGHLVSRIP